MTEPLFVFEDIVVPDADDILGPAEEIELPEEVEEAKGSVWDSGQKENIWRGAEPKDIWTADPNGNEKEAWTSDEDTHDDHQESNGAFGDIF